MHTIIRLSLVGTLLVLRTALADDSRVPRPPYAKARAKIQQLYWEMAGVVAPPVGSSRSEVAAVYGPGEQDKNQSYQTTEGESPWVYRLTKRFGLRLAFRDGQVSQVPLGLERAGDIRGIPGVGVMSMADFHRRVVAVEVLLDAYLIHKEKIDKAPWNKEKSEPAAPADR